MRNFKFRLRWFRYNLPLFFTIPFDLKKGTPVYIFQMGKVGSMSIYEALKKSAYPGLVLHGHSIKSSHYRYDIRTIHHYGIINKEPLKVISLIREPISRSISAFFQNYSKLTGQKPEHPVSDDELLALFLKNAPVLQTHSWFDEHILPFLGIDVYSKEFPVSRVQTYKNGNIEMLLLDSAMPDKQKEKEICDFLQLKNLKIERTNLSSEQNFALLYQQFKKNIHLPSDFIKSELSTKYAKHFFK